MDADGAAWNSCRHWKRGRITLFTGSRLDYGAAPARGRGRIAYERASAASNPTISAESRAIGVAVGLITTECGALERLRDRMRSVRMAESGTAVTGSQ